MHFCSLEAFGGYCMILGIQRLVCALIDSFCILSSVNRLKPTLWVDVCSAVWTCWTCTYLSIFCGVGFLSARAHNVCCSRHRSGLWLLGSGLLHVDVPENQKEPHQCGVFRPGSVQQVGFACSEQISRTAVCCACLLCSVVCFFHSLMFPLYSGVPASTVVTGSSGGGWRSMGRSRRRLSLVL